MPVYFAYRSPHGNPTGLHVRTFAADAVLDWFRSVWRPIPHGDGHPAWRFAEGLVGTGVHSFGGLFADIAEHGWPPPTDMAELASCLRSSMYVTDDDHVRHGPHHIQVLTDDDDLDMAMYVFDGHFAARHPDRTAFLALPNQELPDGAADGPFVPATDTPTAGRPGPWAGATYFAFTYHSDSSSLEDLNDCRDCHHRFDGVLLSVPESPEWDGMPPPLWGWLRTAVSAATGGEAALLAGVVADPFDDAAYAAYSDWLEEHGHRPAGEHLLDRMFALGSLDRDGREPDKDIRRVGRHVAQFCKAEAYYGYAHHVLFDDVWAAAHPDLADSILRFASRWDCL